MTDEFDASEEIEIEVDPPVIPDPDDIAADLLIERALNKPGLRKSVVAPGSAVILHVPDASWVDAVAESWCASVRGGVAPLKPGYRRSNEKGPAWREIRRSGTDKTHRPEIGNDDVAADLGAGIAVLGVSPNPGRTLPSDLLRVADHMIVLDPPDLELVREVTRRVTGAAPTQMDPAIAWSALKRNMLLLARRPGQRADDYVARLAQLLTAPKSIANETVTLSRLHGMRDAVTWGTSLCADLTAYRRGELGWSAVDRGALIHGPTGTGKTTFVRALAATAGVPLIATSYATWQSVKEGHLGDVTRSLREAFDEARSAVPSILFIDEIDTIGSRGGGRKFDDWWRAIINALLEQLDGLAGREGVVVVAATNHPATIDPAILRAGRLDREILIDLPDADALAAILREKLRDDAAGINLSAAGLKAVGGTGADCEKWVRGAWRKARQEGRSVRLDDLLAEIDGPEINRSAKFRWRIAVHEAGHAVLAALERPGTLLRVTVREGRQGLGNVMSGSLISDAVTASDVQTVLRILLAGRAAEEVIVGCVSSGAGGSEQSDLALATNLIAAAEYGLGLGASLVWHGKPDGKLVQQLFASNPRLMARVSTLLDASYGLSVKSIREHRNLVVKLASALLESGTMSGAEIDLMVASATAPRLARRVQAQMDGAYSDARDLVRARLDAVKAVAYALVAKRVLDGPEAEGIEQAALGKAGESP